MDYLIIKDLLSQKFNDDIGSLIFEYIPKPRHIMCDIIDDYKSAHKFEIENDFFGWKVNPFKLHCYLELGILRRCRYIR